jgi:hypothetical protein
MKFGTSLCAVALCTILAASPARAQIATSPSPPAGSVPGWSFAINPYIWLPRIVENMKASTPSGGTVNMKIDVGPGDYLTLVNFAAMVGGVARNGRFSVMTDLIYLNDSITSNVSNLSTVNLGQGPIDIPRSLQTHTGTRLAITIWSLASGYTLLQGDWGNLDAIAGLRMVAFDSATNYQLSADIQAPNGMLALSRGGQLNIHNTYFNAIAGVTGRINIPNSKFYLPFYLDAGGGALPFTWQVYGGVAYAATSWADVSIGYRYLAFEKGASTGVQNLALSGVTLGFNIRF